MMEETPKITPAKRKRLLRAFGGCPAGYTNDDLERFLAYDVSPLRRHPRPVLTAVVYGAGVPDAPTTLAGGSFDYQVQAVFLARESAEAGESNPDRGRTVQRARPRANSTNVPTGTPVGPFGSVTRSVSEYAVPAMSRCTHG